MCLQHRQIGRIIRIVGQFDVETALRLAERVIFRAVQRAREDAGITRKDGRSTIALVHIAINDRGTLQTADCPAAAGFQPSLASAVLSVIFVMNEFVDNE